MVKRTGARVRGGGGGHVHGARATHLTEHSNGLHRADSECVARVTARHTGRSVVGAGVDSCSSPWCVLARLATRSTVKALARDTFAETRDATCGNDEGKLRRVVMLWPDKQVGARTEAS